VNTVYYGTNRVVESEDPVRFGDAYNAGKPYYFRVGEVPVEKVGDPWNTPDGAYRCGQPILYGERPPEDGKAAVLGSKGLFDGLRQTMIDDPRDVLIFLHGFANTFESAMERAAELRDAYLSPATDRETGALKSRGREPLVFAFSWPSDGVSVGLAGGALGDDTRKWAYSSDREDARASGLAIARCAMRLFRYLRDLAAEQRCVQRIHLVAHSMGNWTLRHALQEMVQLANEANQSLLRAFDNTFLMASDINDDCLEKEDWLGPLLRVSRRVHVYHAHNDSALSLSDVKPNHGARLGHFGPATMTGLNDRVSAIDCATVSWTPKLTHVRHQYYRLAPEVLKDVRQVLKGKADDEVTGRIPLGERRYRLRLDAKARRKLGG
jgi:esterase/lipase superfamily enzyme